jgi:dienelactone hydrolase
MAEPAPASKPTIIIVHGAWHRPIHFQHLSEALTSHGYKVVTPALPSVDKAPEHITPDSQADIEAVRGAILAELDGADGPNDVILVPHSYGGIPASGAVRGLDPQSRASAGKLTSVRAIAAITSFILPEGMDIPAARGESEDHAPGAAAAAAAKRERPALVHPPPAALFWQDVPAGSETYAVAESNLNVMSMAALLDRCRFSAFEVVPVHFLLARDDQAMKFATQESMVQRIRDRGRVVRAEVLDGSSHSPFLSRVHETAAFIRRSAGEDV